MLTFRPEDNIKIPFYFTEDCSCRRTHDHKLSVPCRFYKLTDWQNFSPWVIAPDSWLILDGCSTAVGVGLRPPGGTIVDPKGFSPKK